MNVATNLAELINKTTNHSQTQPSIWCASVSTNSIWLIHPLCKAQSIPGVALPFLGQLPPLIQHSPHPALPYMQTPLQVASPLDLLTTGFIKTLCMRHPFNFTLKSMVCNTGSGDPLVSVCMKPFIDRIKYIIFGN